MNTWRTPVAVAILLGMAGGLRAQELKEIRAYKGQWVLALSPDGTLLVTCDGSGRESDLSLWDVTTGQRKARLQAQASFRSGVAFSADGKRFGALSDKALRVWDVGLAKPVAELPHFHVQGTLTLNQDGTKFALVTYERIDLWEVTSGKELASFKTPVHFQPCAFTPDLGTVAVGNFQEIEIRDTVSAKERALLSEHRGGVYRCQFHTDGKTLVSYSYRCTRDQRQVGEVKLWDTSTSREVSTLKAELGFVYELTLSPDGRTLAVIDEGSIGGDGAIRVLDLATGRERFHQKGTKRTFASVAWAGGRLFVLGGNQDSGRLWEVSLPKE